GPVGPTLPSLPSLPFSPLAPSGPVGPVPPPPPPEKQFCRLVYVNGTVVLPIPTVPLLLPWVCSIIGSIAVAVVLLVAFASVINSGNFCAALSIQITEMVDPLKPVPVSLTSVPGHPSFGLADVTVAADAA